MNIRSITYFTSLQLPLGEAALQRAGSFAATAQPAFEAAGYPVQTQRLATTPFPLWNPAWVELSPAALSEQLVSAATTLEAKAKDAGYSYISLGPAVPDLLHSYEAIPSVLAATQNVFLSGIMADTARRISLTAVRACARVIQQASQLSADGFANLRFAALANTPAGTPFFPAAYHAGGAPAFALATEAAELAVQALEGAGSLDEARQILVAELERHAKNLAAAAKEIELSQQLLFGGIDFSLAPFPEEKRSLASAFEQLGVPAVGLHGSLAAAAFLADALDRAHFPRAGFSGLFLPALEDATLARAAAQGTLSVKDLLLYCAVCGAGLDTIPLAGDVTSQEIEALLLDVAALACRLDKPLTARLMPIPGKRAGDPTGFDFAFFANSKVMSLESKPLQGLFIGQEVFDLIPRPRRDRGSGD